MSDPELTMEAALNMGELDEAAPPPQDGSDSPSEPLPAVPPDMTSPTLATLPQDRRPLDKTVCEACPNSVWYATEREVTCYCRVMLMRVWTTAEPQTLIACDGIYLGQEQ